MVQVMQGDKVQVSHNMAKASSPEDAEEGWYLMQDIVKLMNQQHSTGKENTCNFQSTSDVYVLQPLPSVINDSGIISAAIT